MRWNLIQRIDAGRLCAILAAAICLALPGRATAVILYVSNIATSPNRLKHYDGESGSFLGDVVSPSEGALNSLEWGPEGYLWGVGPGGVVSKIDVDAGEVLLSLELDYGDAGIIGDIVLGTDGDLYVSNIGTTPHRLKHYDGESGLFLGDVVSLSEGSLTSLEWGPEGYLWGVGPGGVVSKIDVDAGEVLLSLELDYGDAGLIGDIVVLPEPSPSILLLVGVAALRSKRRGFGMASERS